MPGIRGVVFVCLLWCSTWLVAGTVDVPGQRHCLPLAAQQVVCVHEYHPEASETVVLLHGLNGSARDDWETQIELLAREFHVLAVELPGFDDPSKLPEHYSTAYFAEALAQVIKLYASSPVTLIGHSMGGVIALHYALEEPEQLERLVLVSVPGLLHRMSYSRELVGGWAGGETGQHGGFSAFLEKISMKLLAGLEALSGKAQPSDAMLRSMADNPQAMAAMQLSTRDFSATLHQLAMPILLLWGENDRIAPLRTAHTLLARLPDSRLQVFPDVGHVPMTQASEAFNRTLQQFVMARRWPERAHARPETPVLAERSGRVGQCLRQRGVVFEGSYAHIEIHGCEAILIRHARVGSLQVKASRLEIMNSTIGTANRGVALLSQGADIKITASELLGQSVIAAGGSRIDLAGVTLISDRPVLQIGSDTDLLISLSEHREGLAQRYLHNFYRLERGDDLPYR